VTLSEAEQRLGALDPFESGGPRSPFTFTVGDDYDGHSIEFELTVTEKRGGSWKATIKVSVPPAPPMLLTHDAGTSHVTLNWRPGGTPGVHGYNVYRSNRSGGSYKRITERPVRGMTVFRDNDVKPCKTYYYVITSVTAEGLESAYSQEHEARTLTPLWGRKR
jgi:hypothetical protein